MARKRWGDEDALGISKIYKREFATKTDWNYMPNHEPTPEAARAVRDKRIKLNADMEAEARRLFGDNPKKCREWVYDNMKPSTNEIHEDLDLHDFTQPRPDENFSDLDEEGDVNGDEIDVSSLWSVRTDLKNKFI